MLIALTPDGRRVARGVRAGRARRHRLGTFCACIHPRTEPQRDLLPEAVQPVLTRRFPGLAYSAALIGEGSEVLGFDTPQSMDHDWGLRVLLFLPEAGFAASRDEIRAALEADLGPTVHGVTYRTLSGYFGRLLDVGIFEPLRAVDWLVMPQQYLRSLTSGRVFHDGLGQLEAVRDKLGFYPRDVWLYLLACQWRRVAQEEAFVGRCGQVGDELGSHLAAAPLVRDLMRLCFLGATVRAIHQMAGHGVWAAKMRRGVWASAMRGSRSGHLAGTRADARRRVRAGGPDAQRPGLDGTSDCGGVAVS